MTAQEQAHSDGGFGLTNLWNWAANGLTSMQVNGRLEQYAGYREFRENVTQEGPLREAMAEIMGEENIGPEALERLEALAQHDPEIFTKLNNVMNAEGFDDFAQRVAANPDMRRLFSGMLGGGEGGVSAERASQVITGLSGQVEQTPDFFERVTTAMDDHPQFVARMANRLANDPQGAFTEMQGLMQMQQMFAGGAGGIFGDMDMGNFNWENIGQFFLNLLEGLSQILNGIVSGFTNMLAPQGDAVRPQTAAAALTPEELDRATVGASVTAPAAPQV